MELRISMPPRSALFQLSPEHVGSPQVESFSSYVNALAEEHRVSVRELITGQICKHLASKFCSASLLSGHSYTAISAHNGTGDLAEQWHNSLSALTLRSDLRNLSLLTYKDIFTDKNLIRKQKAWCPRCLDEMQKGSTKRTYEPLLWKIQAVRVCPIHHQFLETRCPKCCREPDHVSRHSRNGYCSRKSCEKWLGNSADLSREEHEIQAELFYATEVGNLLAIMKNFQVAPPRHFIAEYISKLINDHAHGNISGFATLLKMSRESVSDWANGIHLPRLQQLLKMSHFFKVSITRELQSWHCQEIERGGNSSGSPQPKGKKCKPERLSGKALKAGEILESIIAGSIPPQPIKTIAKQCECHPSLLYMHYRDMCAVASKMKKQQTKETVNMQNEIYFSKLLSIMVTNNEGNKLPQRKAMSLLGISSKRLINDLYSLF